MIGPWIVFDSTVYFGIGVTGTFGTKLPNRPISIVLIVQELDESIGGITVRSLRKGRRWAGSSNDLVGQSSARLDQAIRIRMDEVTLLLSVT